jgi:hypothetical protein
VAVVGPPALKALALRLDDPSDLAADVRAVDAVPRCHPADHEQSVADLAVLLEVDLHLLEHLVDVLEPGPHAVVSVVAGVALDARREEWMPFAVGVPDVDPGFRVAPVVGIAEPLEQRLIVRHF